MKNLVFIFLLATTLATYGQPVGSPVVHDPTNHGVLIQQVKEAGKITQAANRTLENLEETKEFLTKINSALSQINAVKEIIVIQKATVEYSDSALRELGKSGVLTQAEFNSLANSFARTIEAISKSIEMADKLLTADLFKMNDAERLEFLQKAKETARNRAYNLYVQKQDWDLEVARRLMYGKQKNN